jgi:hypothetical protein
MTVLKSVSLVLGHPVVSSFSFDSEGEWKNFQRVLKFLSQIFGSETSYRVDNFFIGSLAAKKIRVDYIVISTKKSPGKEFDDRVVSIGYFTCTLENVKRKY